MADDDTKPAAKKAPAKKAAKPNPVVASASGNAELANLAARPYMDTRNVDRPASGRDHSAPGNDAEHPHYSDATVDDRRSTPVETLHFPALVGHPDVETASRTPDRVAAEDSSFRKRFVVIREAYQPDDDAMHARNKLATLQDALNLGLHPQEEASFDGAEDHPDGASIYLDYSVPVIPAVIDGDAASAVTPHHVLRDSYDGSTESEAAADAEGVTAK